MEEWADGSLLVDSLWALNRTYIEEAKPFTHARTHAHITVPKPHTALLGGNNDPLFQMGKLRLKASGVFSQHG